MAQEKDDYKFACYESYYGGPEEVLKSIDECKRCGAKLVFGHLSDFKNLIIHESARCVDCGHENRKIIHVLN